jgi:hypothetical protein
MAMSHEKRLGWSALVSGLLAPAAGILWPEQKWIGWTFFALCVISLLGWAYFEWFEKEAPKERPLIRMNGSGLKVFEGLFGSNQDQYLSLYAEFENVTPAHETEQANARNVFAKLKFYNVDVGLKELFEIDGRWAGSAQPKPGASMQQLLATDIRAGETVRLDVVVRFLDEKDAYALHNDSWQFGLKKPDLKLEGTNFMVKVTLKGTGVKETHSFRFENLGAWNYLR